MVSRSVELRGGAIGVFHPSPERLEHLSVWFEAEYPALLRFAYFVGGDAATAEDLVQEAFVRLYRAGTRLDAATLPAYTRRTVVNLHRSAFRRRRSETASIARAPARVVVEPHDPGARDEMWNAVLHLSPQQRAIVALRYYEDMSEHDVAETLGIGIGSVKKQTSRAMERLRALLGRQP